MAAEALLGARAHTSSLLSFFYEMEAGSARVLAVLVALCSALFLSTFVTGVIQHRGLLWSLPLLLKHRDFSLRHAAFQVAAWVCWDVSTVLLLLPVPQVHRALPAPVLGALRSCDITARSRETLGAALVVAIIAEVLLINSFLVFEYYTRQGWVPSLDAPLGSGQHDGDRPSNGGPVDGADRTMASDGETAPPARRAAVIRRMSSVDRAPGDAAPPAPHRTHSRHKRAMSHDAASLHEHVGRAQTLVEKVRTLGEMRRQGRQLAALVVVLGCALAATSGALAVASVAAVRTRCLQLIYLGLSAVSLLVAANSTHGLGGWLRWRHAPPQHGASSWRFFQPFRGGTAFMATQGAGWAFFCLALAGLVTASRMVAAGAVQWLHHVSWATAAAVLAAQTLLGVSIFRFKVTRTTRTVLPAAAQEQQAAPAWVDARQEYTVGQLTWAALVILIPWALPHILVAFLALPFLILPWTSALILHLAWLLPYSVAFGVGPDVNDFHLGRREWPLVQEWFGRAVSQAMPMWVGGLRLLCDAPWDDNASGDGAAESSTRARRLVFAYHPHGLMPAAAAYFHLLPDFRRLFPGVRPVLLVASAIFAPPFLRDVLSWFGGRPIQRRTFSWAIKERHAVVVVPGGQQEMVWAYRVKRHKERCLVTGHLGFIKMAILHGAAVVPTLCFGEIDSLTNLVDTPELHRMTYRRLGFPIPFIVVGKWGLLPFPKRRPQTFVVGKPIDVPPCPDLSRHIASGRAARAQREAGRRRAKSATLQTIAEGPDVGTSAGGARAQKLGRVPSGKPSDVPAGEAGAVVECDDVETETEDAPALSAVAWDQGSATGRGGDGRGRDAAGVAEDDAVGPQDGPPKSRDFTEDELKLVWHAPELEAAARAFRDKYYQAVVELFERHKASSGYGDYVIRLLDDDGRGTTADGLSKKTR